MDFFDRQDAARRHTKSLVLYFSAGVVALIVAIYLAVAVLFVGLGAAQNRRHAFIEAEPGIASLWNPRLFLGVTVATLAVVGMGSLFKTMELSRGGGAVATMLGGRLVNPATTDPDERRLLNVVEEMAIAAGIPMPQVYLLPAEDGINAFAAGHSTSDAAVAVTRGALKLLTRDELQGVIGHEFSHILNGDMRLNLRLMGIVFGILCLAVIGRVLLEFRGDRRDRNPLPLLGLALLAIGWIGVFFGRLIQSAVSRQREYLADASSVQFTRNPAGLAGALKKIGGLSCGSRMRAAHAEEASHLFFGNGMGESFLGLMETHPPLAKRILAIDPSFDGTFPKVTFEDADEASALAASAASRFPNPFPGVPGRQPFGVSALTAPPVITARSVMPTLGNPTTEHLRYAAGLRDDLPETLKTAARDSFGASALVYALLLSDEETARRKQLDELAATASDGICRETLLLLPQIQALPAGAKLPLVDIALPALRQMSPDQFEQFRAAVQTLVESDQEIDLFEYTIQKIVLRHLEPHYAPARRQVIQYYAIKPLAPDCAIILSALAHIGQTEPQAVETAFQQGAQLVGLAAHTAIPLLPAEACGLARIDAALERLSQSAPQIKKNVIRACIETVAADGVIQEAEAELLRAIADTLDCPLPPFLATGAAPC